MKQMRERERERERVRTLKTRLAELKLGRRNLMNEKTAQQLDTTV